MNRKKPQKKKVKKVVKKEVMDDFQPLVSVVLPFYNAPHLQEAIESILDQTYANFELLLIDNGSFDHSAEVAQTYARHAKVRLLNEPEKGVVFAANKGIAQANGDLIARMDADDISNPERLERQVEMFRNKPALSVVSGLVEYLGSPQNEGFLTYVDWLNSVKTTTDIWFNQFVEFPLANPSLMIRKEVFTQYGGYQEGDFPEDYEFFLRLQCAGVEMDKVDEVVLSWRDIPSRLTRTDSRYSQDAFFKVKAKYLALWLSAHNAFHPDIFIWGAGRLSRRRSEYLLNEGVNVVKYIDLKESDRVLHYTSIPAPSEAFVVSYVGNRGVRSKIRNFLDQQGYKEGANYIMAS
ncbi:MAG: glycosyltransferase [Ekhidna sp.]